MAKTLPLLMDKLSLDPTPRDGGLTRLQIFFLIVLTSFLGASIVYWELRSQYRAHLQTLVSEHARVLSSQVSQYIGGNLETISKVGAAEVILATQAPDTPKLGPLDSSIEILDISVWKQENDSAVFDLYPSFKRVYLAANEKGTTVSIPEWSQILQGSDEAEKAFIQLAFQGHTYIGLAPPISQQKDIALIAFPLNSGTNEEKRHVVVAHMKLDILEKVFGASKKVLSVLADDSGGVLAHSMPEAVGAKGKLAQVPLFQMQQNSKQNFGELEFLDYQGNNFLGSFSKVGMGRLVVLSTLPDSDLGPYWIQKLLILVSLFGGVGFWFSGRLKVYVQKRKQQEIDDLTPVPLLSTEASSEGESIPVPQGWMVNNGSQIEGPFTGREIALRLFTQDLDFDCECWQQGVGTPTTIFEAGLFSGASTNDGDAHLWIFDGETIHGPVSSGFIHTALGHQAVSEKSYICEKSTVQGWKPILEWLEQANHKMPSLKIPEPLRSSLAPPPPGANEKIEQRAEPDAIQSQKKAA